MCLPGQQIQYGTAKSEAAHVVCQVDANPADVTFRWQFNSSMETLDLPFSQVSTETLDQPFSQVSTETLDLSFSQVSTPAGPALLSGQYTSWTCPSPRSVHHLDLPFS